MSGFFVHDLIDDHERFPQALVIVWRMLAAGNIGISVAVLADVSIATVTKILLLNWSSA